MNSELCYFQGGIKTAPSVMSLCRYIKMTRLCDENFRDKFYIFNTYFYGKLEEALRRPVRIFYVMKSYFSRMSCIMFLLKIGIITLFWVRIIHERLLICLHHFFFANCVKRAAHPFVKKE